jgi:hypothetical protein
MKDFRPKKFEQSNVTVDCSVTTGEPASLKKKKARF